MNPHILRMLEDTFSPDAAYLKCYVLGVIEKILLSFSIYTNGVKILSTNQASGSLGAVNGIRFLSMAWVILGHSYFFAIGFDGKYQCRFLSTSITKTRLFKHIKNFTTKKGKFSDKKILFFHIEQK